MKFKLLIGSLVTALTLALPVAANAETVIGHRGDGMDGHRPAGVTYTENTLKAAHYGIATAGADYVETDVQMTKSDYPVIMHDATLDRTTKCSGKIADKWVSTVTACKTNDGQNVPTLWAWLHQVDIDGGKALVELKSVPTATQWANLKTKIPANMSGRVIFQSFYASALTRPKNDGYPVFLLSSTLKTTYAYDGVAIKYTVLTKSYVDNEKAHGVKVFVWTPDSAANLSKFVDMGVTGIITNQPKRAVDAR